MKKVNNKLAYANLFKEYTHNIPVIFSSLEDQYDGQLFVDNTEDCKLAILLTPFDFHFVAGDLSDEHIAEKLEQFYYYDFIKAHHVKEAILFCPNAYWYPLLDQIHNKHHGIKDCRKVFKLNSTKFSTLNGADILDVGFSPKLEYIQECNSKIPFPSARILEQDKVISFCNGFMLGNGHAEIDVSTEEAYRRKGCAKATAYLLISELISKNTIPDWCTWPYRIESQKLAQSLGYELENEIPAYIWVEEACGQIE